MERITTPSAASDGPLLALAEHGIEIPLGIAGLGCFREWTRSAGFPERGRIDWVEGRVEVDMTPEDLNTHGSPKSAIAGVLIGRIQEADRIQEAGRGLVYIDRARIANPAADLSAEPDVAVLLFETVESGGARLVRKSTGVAGRFVEIEGRADLVVECVSDSSETKDRERLREAYSRAGIPEYWLVDARPETPVLEVLRLVGGHYEDVAADAHGFRRSEILDAGVRLVRRRVQADLVVFRLETGGD